MRDDLILLASSNVPNNRSFLNKYLIGYSTIQFVTEIRGTLFVAYDDQEYHLSGGDWFFPAHPGPRLRFNPLQPGDTWHHRHIGFQGPLVEQWRAAGLWLDRPQPAPPGQDWAGRMDELYDLFRRSGRFARLRAVNRLESLVLELAEARVGQDEPDPWLGEVLKHLDSEETPDLGKLGAEFGLSATALRRRFKAATGLTMQDHVLQKRIAAARALLSDTDLPLKAIAARLGYKNEFFFSRQFRAMTGVAPGAFRKSGRLG